ncbi:hypothetical protein QUA43_13150 [Microcoleus sp. N9_B4]|jgi:hypothetical protein|uniref:hypothetical protein n=1 Tax=Microcoleus sp. N9_B4 TaxID=3055386 RepID=UPI002FD48A51
MASSFPSGFDSVISEAWVTLQDANHKALAYNLRASQITKWKRLRDFVSLGVAPGLLIATTVWNNELLRNFLVVFSGLCSLASWLWVLFGLSYNWDNQLRVSIDVPPKLSELVSEMKEAIEIFTNAQNNNKQQEAKDAAAKLRILIQRVNSLGHEIRRDQVYASPWMNLMATQNTMQSCSAKCGSCYQMWIPGSEVFNSDKAKRFLKKAKQGKIKGVCEFCGQNLPRTP